MVVLAVLSTLLVTASGPSAVAETASAAHLRTEEPVSFGGQLIAEGGSGLGARWERPIQARLSAEAVTVEMEVAEGERIATPGGGQVWHQSSNGSFSRTFTDATVNFDAWQWPGQLVVEQDDRVETSTGGRGPITLDIVEDRRLAWAGTGRGEAADRSGFPSYEARVEDPRLLLSDSETGRAEGSFALFANNVTMTVGHGDGETWRNWTGYRTEDVAGPAQEYELRITRLLVEDGRLEVHGGALELVGPRLTLENRGGFRADEVQGTVTLPSEEVVSVDGPLVVSGSSSITANTTNGSQEDGERDRAISLEVEGRFEARSSGSQPLFPLAEEGGRDGSQLWQLGIPALLGLAGIAAVREPRLLRPLPARWRTKLYRRWEDAGVDREARGNHAAAARFYRRLTKLVPSRPMGWYLLARTRLERGETERAIEAVEEARREAAAVPVDLLELGAAALVEEGRGEPATDVLEEIGERDPGAACEVARRLDLGERIEERGAGWWRPGRTRGPRDGYV